MDTGSLPIQRMEPEAVKVRWHPYTLSLLFNTTHAHGVPKQMMPWETTLLGQELIHPLGRKQLFCLKNKRA